MHIPDGFLSTATWAPAWLVSAAGLGYCLRKTTRVLKDRMIPLMGITAAFVFAAQMLNFPVMAGTSGHFLGGVLTAVLVGPHAGAIVIAAVLVIQCLIFQDGGLTALGANMLNLSLIGTAGAYCAYVLFKKIIGETRMIAAAGLAAWFSAVAAASACGIELAVSGTSPLQVVLPAMLTVHALIGIGEAVITTAVISLVLKVRPDLIYQPAEK